MYGGGFFRNWSLARMSWYLLRVRKSLRAITRFWTKRDMNFSSTWQQEQETGRQVFNNRLFSSTSTHTNTLSHTNKLSVATLNYTGLISTDKQTCTDWIEALPSQETHNNTEICQIFSSSCCNTLIMGAEMEAVLQTDNSKSIYSSSWQQIMGGWVITISISALWNCCSRKEIG